MTELREVFSLDGNIIMRDNLGTLFKKYANRYFCQRGKLFSFPVDSPILEYYVLRLRDKDIYLKIESRKARSVPTHEVLNRFARPVKYALIWKGQPIGLCLYGMDLSDEPRKIQTLRGVSHAKRVSVPIDIEQHPFPYVPLIPVWVTLDAYTPASKLEEIAEKQLISGIGTAIRLGTGGKTRYAFTCGLRAIAGDKVYYGLRNGTVVYFDTNLRRVFWVKGKTNSPREEIFITHILEGNPNPEVF